MGQVMPLLNVESAAWIAPRLAGEFGAVTRLALAIWEGYGWV